MPHTDRRFFIGAALGGLLLPRVGLSAGWVGNIRDALGPGFGAARPTRRPRPRLATDLTTSLLRWNQIAIDASGLDHTPPAPGEARVFGELLGPCRASRAMAITHLAIYDAVLAIAGQYRGRQPPPPTRGATAQAAVAQAAHDALVHLFPSQTRAFDALLTEDINAVGDGGVLRLSVQLGQRSAAAVLAARTGDGSEFAEPKLGTGHMTSNMPGHWRQDPITQSPIALGAYWSGVRPFVLRSAEQFRVPQPPPLASVDYATAFAEALRLGGDGITTPTQRTAEQTIAGIFWAYDGTPSLCAPPRLYSQIATTVAAQQGTEGIGLARLLALINIAMADASIAIWDSKYYYDFWRPVTGIREASVGTGPTGAGDGNDATIADPTYTPLGAPASNLVGPNFTPPFPAYPSGHAGFGGALFQMLRRFYGTDDIAFNFVSDEFNGVTTDRSGNVRPLLSRNFPRLSAAEEENGQSRIFFSASTGPSTKSLALHRGARLLTTFSNVRYALASTANN